MAGKRMMGLRHRYWAILLLAGAFLMGAGNFLSWGTVPIKVNDDRGTVTREAKGNFAPNTPSGARNDYYLPA